MESKQLRVSEEIRNKLFAYKFENRLKNMDEVIKHIIQQKKLEI